MPKIHRIIKTIKLLRDIAIMYQRKSQLFPSCKVSPLLIKLKALYMDGQLKLAPTLTGLLQHPNRRIYHPCSNRWIKSLR